ncbi:MAG: acyl-CoA desaturase [Stagnimonas sp.]|nr:acyl-CoA desaturase [Stagnimonas sp.]
MTLFQSPASDTEISSHDAISTPARKPRAKARPKATAVTATSAYLTKAQADAFGREMDAIRETVIASRGAKDAAYIRRMIRIQRGTEIGGRALIYAGIVFPPAFLVGAATLGAAKILDNMEVGHNIMHGQWDWMRDPKIHSSRWEWDTACPADQWKHSHNVEHHTWTNVVGKDKDVGYGILRMSSQEPWQPRHLLNPINNALLATLFQWGVAVHDTGIEQVRTPSALKNMAPEMKAKLRGVWQKAKKQVLKDYVLFPALAGPFFLPVLAANVGANLTRNFWTYMIIFCGHFPDGVQQFSEESIKGESRGQWYLRQLLGSANIEGGKLFHVMSGNLSFQIEHHLFPDLPSNRYAEIAPQVQAICEKYGLPYNSASLSRQFGTTIKRVFQMAVPNRQELKAAFA